MFSFVLYSSSSSDILFAAALLLVVGVLFSRSPFFFRLVLGYLVLIQFRKAQTKINTRSQFRVDSVQKVL